MDFGVLFASSILLAFVLDLLLADPSWMPHPVVVIGRLISFLEKRLNESACEEEKTSPDKRKRNAGKLMVFTVVALTWIVTVGLCYLAWRIHPGLFFVLHTVWCWQAIACRGLAKEAGKVKKALGDPTDLTDAREAVARIVGRDTGSLDESGIIKATVETVAENFSDGVVAPLFYMVIGGAPLALTYKAINTMDSMVGYKNEKYLDFGRTAALLDDVVNYVPSRLAAILWIASAAVVMRRGKQAAYIWRRDRRNHASPNSAQTESACAGALGVQLAGPAYYFGELYDKPDIGDDERPVEIEDISRSVKMMYAASALAMLLALALVIVFKTLI